MKKLMTMVGAATMAFGLCAETADLIEASVDFANETAGEKYTFPADEDSGAQLWFNYESAEGTITEGDPNFLTLEADAPVYRTFAGVNLQTEPASMEQVDIAVAEERDGIVIDQKVKFSAFDAETEAIDVEAGAKIAVWVKADELDDTKGTLQITTAELDPDSFEAKPKTINTEIEVAVADMHQLKITAIKAGTLNDGENDLVLPGFTIQIDDTVLDCATDLFPAYDGYTAQAQELIAAGKLFPSMISYNALAEYNPGTLVGVAYKGTGAIESIDISAEPLFDVSLPEADVAAIPADELPEGLDAAWSFTAKEGVVAPLYNEWKANFVVSADKAVEADTVKIGGKFADMGWNIYSMPALEAGATMDVVDASYADQCTWANLRDVIKTFSCGAGATDALKEDTTFTVKLVIRDGEGTEIEITNVVCTVTAKAQEPDPTVIKPDDPSLVGKKATEIFTKIPADFAKVDASKFAAWCQIDGNATLVGDLGAAAKIDAFLLNCLNTQEAIDEAKKDFVIASIEFVDGEWVVLVKDEDAETTAYKNGFVKIIPAEELKDVAEEGVAEFFKAQLVAEPVEE